MHDKADTAAIGTAWTISTIDYQPSGHSDLPLKSRFMSPATALLLLLAAAARQEQSSPELQTTVALLAELEGCTGRENSVEQRATLIRNLREAALRLRAAL